MFSLPLRGEIWPEETMQSPQLCMGIVYLSSVTKSGWTRYVTFLPLFNASISRPVFAK